MADMLVAITEAMLDNVIILVIKDDVFVFCCESSNMEAASRNTWKLVCNFCVDVER